MVVYGDEELLMLSGIQHYCFCPRQWALIHIEQTWADNRLTVEGEHLHQRVDNPLLMVKRRDIVTLRSVQLVSRVLGLYGLSDVVELHRSDTADNAITHPQYSGYWQLLPVEYKRGKPKQDDRDAVQLCAQAICLEEVYKVHISKGYLYYGETSHRVEVEFTNRLREVVAELSKQMHDCFNNGKTPLAVYKTHCRSCSLIETCMPKTFSTPRSVAYYLKPLMNEEEL
ncbi:MAG: CRISPR-associated protein Cas4 [Phocaeicola sp.]